MRTGKVVLATGAGSGIGRAPSELEEVAALLQDSGTDTKTLDADVSRENKMEAAVARLIERFGRLDAVVANASINGAWAPIEDITPEEWARRSPPPTS